MSLRPEIAGFSLAKMRSHFGSEDNATIEHVISRLDKVAQEIEDEDAASAYRDSVATTIRAVVMHGPPIDGLEVEEDPHFEVAYVLAMYQQETYGVGSNCWKMGAFWEFQEAYNRKLAAPAQPLLEFLISGRPLFAPAMEIDWSYYAYLTNEEVRILLAALRKLQEDESALAGQGYLDGFVDTFIGWLAAIDERGMDLWLLRRRQHRKRIVCFAKLIERAFHAELKMKIESIRGCCN